MTNIRWAPHSTFPGDQRADLFGAFWAEVGPDAWFAEDGWSWTIFDLEHDNQIVKFGYSMSEQAAKLAVDSWTRENAPPPAEPPRVRGRWFRRAVR